MKFREIGLEYVEDLETGTMIPDIEAPSRSDMTIGARKAMDALDEFCDSMLDATMMCGLGDRIFEEIAERATKSALTTRSNLKNSGMTVWEIEAEADKAWQTTMEALLQDLIEANRHLNFPELRQWQLPPEQ